MWERAPGRSLPVGVTDTPGQATTALFADPEGNIIGLVKA